MIKTTHPINCDFIKFSCSAKNDKDILKVDKTYQEYNKALLDIQPNFSENILHSFFNEGPEQISGSDITVENIEIDSEDNIIQFNIKSFFHGQDKNAIGSLLFTGTHDLIAEFDDSPITEDYLIELLQDRDLFDVYFDVLPDNNFVIDIYSLNEEPEEDGKDDDDFQVLHLQFKFATYSADLEAISPEPDKSENIDAMDTFD